MEYKGYEIKEEVLDWLVEISNASFLEERLKEEVHEIRRIGNYIGFRQTLAESKQYLHK